MPLPPQGAKTALKQTRGGFNSATVYSGAVAPGLAASPLAFATGPDVMFCSGAGRLDNITVWLSAASSGLQTAITFYDAHTPVSGGPIYASGHKVLANLPAFMSPVVAAGLAVASGVESVYYPAFASPILIDVPFQSGLCVNSRSGQIGFTVTWTPEQANM